MRTDPTILEGKEGGGGPCGRTERKPFGHTGRLEPQPRGAGTRRAVAKRRSRRQRLDSPLGCGYPGVSILVLLPGPLARSAAVFRKSFVFSFLPIRKVLVSLFAGGGLPVVSLLFSASYPQGRRSYYLFFNYLFFNYLYRSIRIGAESSGESIRIGAESSGESIRIGVENSPASLAPVDKPRGGGRPGHRKKPQERLSAVRRPRGRPRLAGPSGASFAVLAC